MFSMYANLTPTGRRWLHRNLHGWLQEFWWATDLLPLSLWPEMVRPSGQWFKVRLCGLVVCGGGLLATTISWLWWACRWNVSLCWLGRCLLYILFVGVWCLFTILACYCLCCRTWYERNKSFYRTCSRVQLGVVGHQIQQRDGLWVWLQLGFGKCRMFLLPYLCDFWGSIAWNGPILALMFILMPLLRASPYAVPTHLRAWRGIHFYSLIVMHR